MEKLLKDLKEQIHYDPFSGHAYWLPHTYAFTLAKAKNKLVNGLAVAGCPNNKGYILVSFNGSRFPLHRLAWLFVTGSLPLKGQDIDHINMNKTDNRFSNLRLASRSQNNTNRGPNKTRLNGCKYKGVYWRDRKTQWTAQIGIGGKTKNLGFFKTQEAAARAYDAAAREQHGEFVRLNFTENK